MQRSLVAIIISLIGIAILVRINFTIARIYCLAGGKTQGMFGLLELGFFYKYYIALFGIIAIALSIIALNKGEKRIWVIPALTTSSLALLLTFLKIWKLMV